MLDSEGLCLLRGNGELVQLCLKGCYLGLSLRDCNPACSVSCCGCLGWGLCLAVRLYLSVLHSNGLAEPSEPIEGEAAKGPN